MPDHRRGAEGDHPAGLADAPAQIHVVAGDAESRIEPAQIAQRLGAERHVAAGDVLGLAVGEQDVGRPAGGLGDAGREERLVRRRHVRPPRRPRHSSRRERADEVSEPLRVGHGVVVEVGDDLARGRLQAGVAGGTEASIFRPQETEAEVL